MVPRHAAPGAHRSSTSSSASASGPVSVFVADAHGELVAAATMDGAAPDTRLNAQRKAYTAARSDARTTRELAEKVSDDPVERASFDPFFTFFLGGVAVFDGERGSARSASAASRARSTSSWRCALSNDQRIAEDVVLVAASRRELRHDRAVRLRPGTSAACRAGS